MADIIVKRIPALPNGANAKAGYKLAVWNSLTNQTQQFDVSEFLNEVQSGNYDWVSTNTYALNEVVFYQNKLWASLQNGNVGNAPSTGVWWSEVTQGEASGLKNWAAGAYTADDVFVVYDPGSGNNLYELISPVRPYLSVDIDAEITAGDWAPFSLSVSDLTYDGARAIKALPAIGQNVGSASIIDFLDGIYFPTQIQSVSISNQPILEVGVSHSPNIVGSIDPKDSIISARRVREVIGNTIVANPAGDAVNETLASVIIIAGTTKTYRIETDSDLAVGVNSVNKNLTGVYPYMYGFGAAGLVGNPLYLALAKIIEAQGNKTPSMVGTNQKAYFIFPEDYPNLSSIIDPNGFEVLGATWPLLPTIVSVISSGLASNWTKNYKVYESTLNTTMNGTFIFKH